MSAEVSTKHPHEPEQPPMIDPEGRCLVCSRLYHLDVIAAQQLRISRLTEMLQKHEWHDGRRGSWCQTCGGFQEFGHHPDCALAALLAETPE